MRLLKGVVDITQKYQFTLCGYTCDPEKFTVQKGYADYGAKPRNTFEDLPDDWFCLKRRASETDLRGLM